MSTLHVELVSDAASPARARRAIDLWFAQHHLGDSGAARLVVSELVTNAVLHGNEPIRLRAMFDGPLVRVEVFDSSPDTAAVVEQTRDAARIGGHGLAIVAVYARQWGTTQEPGGKVVWVELDQDAHSSA
jgi:anti-sigma regulatory factor (Ser/Thr protein kinase)